MSRWHTSWRKFWTKADTDEDSTGGSPSTSVTMMGGSDTVSEWYSMRWNTTLTICVSDALAVFWLTSLLDSRKML